MKLQLREYQEEAHDRTNAAEARGVRRQLGVAATGLGKTIIFASLAERRGGRALVLAHRDELIAQAAAKVLEVWPELGATDTVLDLLRASQDEHLQRLARTVGRNPRGVGIVKAEANDVLAHVVVASVQTLSRAKRLGRLLQPMDPQWQLLGHADPFDLVVVDEAHHAAADSYRKVLDALRAGQPGCTCGEPHERAATPDEVDAGCELGVAYDPCPMVPQGPLLLGVTATPDRGDGKGLDDLFDEIVWTYDLLWGIRKGYLSDLRGVRIKLADFDLGNVKVNRGDYDQGAAGRALQDAGAPRFIVKAWQADHTLPGGEVITARDRKTLVFTPTVALAAEVAAEFVGAGIPAAMVSAETPQEDRRRILREFSAGTITVLANCAVLTEGYDEPGVSCIVVARPTRSRALYTQMVGRGTRRHPDKADCLVLDVVEATAEHSLVTIPSLFGIDPKVRPYREGEPITGAVADHDRELVRLGRLTAEEADLFAAVRQQGLAWVAIHQPGEELRRYVISLGRDDAGEQLPLVVLAQREAGADELWTAGLQYQDGTKRALITNVAMETAQGVAEDYVRKLGPRAVVLADADAPWRKRKPSPRALAAAKKWRLVIDPKWNAGQLSDAMNAHIARINARKQAKRQPVNTEK
ncbi:MAG: hypothetical protein SHS37scaffold145_38 [Phage 71_18]|nr:MAG: hypothetical protein SHS37scaffold145_38 [Phage 71_18]